MKKFKLLSVFLCSMAVTLSSCVVANPVTTTTPAPTTSKTTSGSGSTTQPQSVVLQSISLSEVKTSYELGENFEKPIVTAHFSDKSSKNVTDKAKFSGFDSSKVGKQTINVDYTENAVKKSASFQIEVSIFGWDAETVANMRECLDDTVLPYIGSIWSFGFFPEDHAMAMISPNFSCAEVEAILLKAGMTYIGDDKYGDPLYTYPSTHGTVTVNVWLYQNQYARIDASYERAFLSDWTAEDKAVMKTYLYDLVLQHPNGLWGEVTCSNGVDVMTHTKDEITPENVAKTYTQNGYLVLLDQQGGYIFTKTAPSKEGTTTMYINGSIYVDGTTGYLTISARASDTPEVSDTFYVTVDQSNPWVHDEVVLTVVRGNYYSDAVPEVTVSPAGAASYLDYDAGKFTYLINANSGKITFTVELPEEGAKATVSVNVSTVGDWTNEQKAEQTVKLNGNILPFTPARWAAEDKGDTYFAVTTTDVTQDAVENTFVKDSRFSYEGSTSSGIEVYTYDDKYGVVAVGIYTEEAAEGEDYDSVHILSYFQQHAWDSADITILNKKLYGYNMPHPLGEWHLEVSDYDGTVIARTEDTRITINDVVDAFLAGGCLVKKESDKNRYSFSVYHAGGYINGYIYMSNGLPCVALTIAFDPILDDTFELSADSYLPRGGDVVTVTVTRGSYYDGDEVTLKASTEGFVTIEDIGNDQFAVTVISEDAGSVDLTAYINGEDSGVSITLTILAYDWLDEEKAILAEMFTEAPTYNMPCFGIGWTLDGDATMVIAQVETTGVVEDVETLLLSSSDDMNVYKEGLLALLVDNGIYFFNVYESEGFTYVVVQFAANVNDWTDADYALFDTYLSSFAPICVPGYYSDWEYVSSMGAVAAECYNIDAYSYALIYYSYGFDLYYGDSSHTWFIAQYALTFEYTYNVIFYPTTDFGCELYVYITYEPAYDAFPADIITENLREGLEDDTFEPVLVVPTGEMYKVVEYDGYFCVVVKVADDADVNEVASNYLTALVASDYYYYAYYDVYFDPTFSFYLQVTNINTSNNTFEIYFLY